MLSTGTFAVMIACTLPSGLLGFVPLWEGRKEGRTASMYMAASEPPNPLWPLFGRFIDLLGKRIFFDVLYIAISCYVHPL